MIRYELIEYKIAIPETAKNISSSPFNDLEAFLSEGKRKIDKAITEIRKKIRKSRIKFFQKLLQESAFGILGIYFTIVSGVLSPLLFTLNSAKNIIDEFGSMIEKKKEIKEENSLAILLSMAPENRR